MLKLVLLAVLAVSTIQLHLAIQYYTDISAKNLMDGDNDGQREYFQSLITK